jgi:hypothetical protein
MKHEEGKENLFKLEKARNYFTLIRSLNTSDVMYHQQRA